MKTKKLVTLTLILTSLLPALSLAQAAEMYQPEKLQWVNKQVKKSLADGENPIVVFDLDDTLIVTAPRMALIIREFAKMKLESGVTSPELIALQSFGSYDVRWGADGSVRGFGIQDEKLIAELDSWVMDRFLGNTYCAGDEPVIGAAAFLHSLVNDGATLVYLTGRDSLNMQAPTLDNFRRRGFPLPAKNVHLMMKPTRMGNDLEFKKSKFSEIESLGKVIAVFENEPVNLNEMLSTFQDATGFFVDLRHTPKLARPADKAVWIHDYFNR
jgi:hypothetical protein